MKAIVKCTDICGFLTIAFFLVLLSSLISHFINILIATLIDNVIKQLMTERLIIFICLAFPWQSQVDIPFFTETRSPFIKKKENVLFLCLKGFC